jgi:hypothetical protein
LYDARRPTEREEVLVAIDQGIWRDGIVGEGHLLGKQHGRYNLVTAA